MIFVYFQINLTKLNNVFSKYFELDYDNKLKYNVNLLLIRYDIYTSINKSFSNLVINTSLFFDNIIT